MSCCYPRMTLLAQLTTVCGWAHGLSILFIGNRFDQTWATWLSSLQSDSE